MNGTIEPNEIEILIRDQLLALPVIEHAQGIPNPLWLESEHGGVLEADNSAAVHLKFRVVVLSVAAAGAQYAESTKVTSQLQIEFFYRLRPGRAVSDGRAAWSAARDVRRAVMAPLDPRLAISLVEAGRPFADESGEVRLIQQVYNVTHEIEV